MVRRYSDEQLDEMAAFYEEHGAVKLPGLIEPEWVDKTLAVIDEMAARADEPIPEGSPLSYGRADGRMTIRYLWTQSQAIRDFLLRPEMAEPIARIIGSRQLRFWFDLTFMHNGAKEGGPGAGSPWHHDIASFAWKGDHVASLWMAMTPSDADRSRLMFIDGSHRTAPGFYRNFEQLTYDGQEDGFRTIPDFKALIAEGKETVLTWDCEPGDAIIIHPYTVHGADGNTGAKEGRRVAITTRWLGDDVRYLPTHYDPGLTPYTAGLKSPLMAQSNLVMGGRPHGPNFPLVWDNGPPQADATAQAPTAR